MEDASKLSENESNENIEVEKDFNLKSNIEQIMSKKYYNRLMIKLKRLEALCIVIIVLLGAIIIINVVSFNRPIAEARINNKTLPSSINKVVANNTINQIKDYYNNNDSMELYNLLDDYDKSQITFNNFTKSLEQFKNLGKLLAASYINYDYWKTVNDENWFILNYSALFDKGTGYVKVTIKANGDKWDIAGFLFNITNANKH
jgi:hypothetical protein